MRDSRPGVRAAIATASDAARTLERLTDDYASVSRLRIFARRAGRDRLLTATALHHEAQLRLAIELAFSQVREHDGSTRNPFHPEILVRLPRVAAITADVARSIAATQGLGASSSELTETVAIAYLNRAVQTMQAIADDPVFLYRRRSSTQRPAVLVQHRSSGLRAEFTALATGQGVFGAIDAGAEQLPSINPLESPENRLEEWAAVSGLGIGRRLYLAGAELLPELRWDVTVATDAAHGVRRALHAQDPYRWAARCEWCGDRGIIWRDATADTYMDHPLAPELSAAELELVDAAHFS